MRNILIVQGHPDAANAHLCHALADSYRNGAQNAGHSVETIDVGALEVPTLTSKAEWMEPPRQAFILDGQKAIKRADHIVFIYPLWLGSMPAQLKAWLEQVLREDFAFQTDNTGWHAKLGGRSARVIVTMGMPSAAYRWFFFAHSLRSFERNILKFCGIKPVRWSIFGTAEDPSGKKQKAYLNETFRNGAAGF